MADTLKVVMAGEYPDSTGEVVGGVQAVTLALSEAISNVAGVDLTVVTFDRTLAGEKMVERANYSVCYLPMNTRAGVLTMQAVNRSALRRKIRQIGPDIVHAQAVGFCALAALQTGVPTLVTAHGISFHETKFRYKDGCMGRLRQRMHNRLGEVVLKRATDMIAISSYTSRALSPYTSARMYSIPNPINNVYWVKRPTVERSGLMYTGLVIPLKGVEYLLQALRLVVDRYPNVVLSLAGRVADQEYCRSLVSYLEENSLVENVRWMGPLDAGTLADMYSSSAVMVLPSLQENAPMVISEAMACGCPIVATDVGSVSDMVADGVTGRVVKSKDPCALASAIIELLDSDDLRRRMGDESSKIAMQRYQARSVAEKTVELYRNILSRS